MTRRRLLATLAAWVVLSIALWLSGADPAVLPLAGIVAVIAASGVVAFDLGTSVRQVRWPAPTSWSSSERANGPGTPRTLRHVDAALRSRSPELRSRLAELVDDRVLTRHGIDPLAAPDDADRLLTPALRRLRDDAHRPVGDRELQTVLNDIEAL